MPYIQYILRDIFVLPQELKGDAKVIAEVEVFLHVDDVVAVVLVLPS